MPPPGTRRNKALRAAAAERRLEAWGLRKAGASFRQIARTLGISHQQAKNDCDAILFELTQEATDHASQWRVTHLHRLEDAVRGLYPQVLKGDPEAIRALVRALQRQSDLLGLDAPKRSELSGVDGGPIQIEQDVNLTLTSEQRLERITFLADVVRSRLAGSLPDGQPRLDAADRGADDSVA